MKTGSTRIAWPLIRLWRRTGIGGDEVSSRESMDGGEIGGGGEIWCGEEVCVGEGVQEGDEIGALLVC
tara:strand:+ start:513 stop:716 length:204 start_codon:yes stop_codon:yes gene_type:complete